MLNLLDPNLAALSVKLRDAPSEANAFEAREAAQATSDN
jgi:hypothetical protein